MHACVRVRVCVCGYICLIAYHRTGAAACREESAAYIYIYMYVCIIYMCVCVCDFIYV